MVWADFMEFKGDRNNQKQLTSRKRAMTLKTDYLTKSNLKEIFKCNFCDREN